MNGNNTPEAPAGGLSVILGQQFTFTENDLTLLCLHLNKALIYFERGNVGWRVLFIREITHINRVIRGALDRAHTNSPTKVSDQLPLI